MSIELFFLINQVMDFTILAAVSRGLGLFRPVRIALASSLAAAYAMLSTLLPWLSAPVPQLGLLLLLAMLLAGSFGFYPTAHAFLSIGVSMLLSGTVARELCGNGLKPTTLLSAGLGAMVSSIHLSLRRRQLPVRPIGIRIVVGGHAARFDALIDTGNRLREPFSGQPVLIASEGLIRNILPDRGYRTVAYGSVGGGGTLRCFRPDRIYAAHRARLQPMPDAWVAIYPDILPGGAKALAPAEFAMY